MSLRVLSEKKIDVCPDFPILGLLAQQWPNLSLGKTILFIFYRQLTATLQ